MRYGEYWMEMLRCTLPGAVPVVNAPLGLGWGQVSMTPAPPPPTPERQHRVPPGDETGPGDNGLLAVDPPREVTHSWLNKAEQRRAGFIFYCNVTESNGERTTRYRECVAVLSPKETEPFVQQKA